MLQFPDIEESKDPVIKKLIIAIVLQINNLVASAVCVIRIREAASVPEKPAETPVPLTFLFSGSLYTRIVRSGRQTRYCHF